MKLDCRMDKQLKCAYCGARTVGKLPTECSGCKRKLSVDLMNAKLFELIRAMKANGARLNIRFITKEDIN